MRADARRNREAVLSSARECFESEGVFASLDGIAVRAGVGNATLYRNFPTREDLLAAVMQAQIDDAVANADEFMQTMSPRDALAEWMQNLAWRLRIWHDLPHCLAAAHTEPTSAMTTAVSPLVERTEVLLNRARVAGDVVPDVTTEETFQLITTVSWAIDRFGDDETASRRRVSLATAGVFAPTSPQP